jgi:3-oxo-5-alpha-steroid 4-dehydrogenase 1
MLEAWSRFVTMPPVLWAWMGLGALVFVFLLRVVAPYGRHRRPGWGLVLPASWAWLAMESAALVGFGACFFMGSHKGASAWLFLLLYGGHYVYRAFIYPWLSSASQPSAMPLSVALMGMLFNGMNSTILGGYLFISGPGPAASEPFGLRGWMGLVLFGAGFAIHVHSDHQLRRLRHDLGPGYHIPDRGLFRLVSCPNYLGEMLQWTGFAVTMNALAGWTFMVWTVANLLPRALKHHAWYQQKFKEYPSGRRAVFPGLL